MGPGKAGGFGLLGLIVTLGLTTVVAGVTYTVYVQTDRARTVAQEGQTLQQLNRTIQASYASSANFDQLNAASVDRDQLFPREVKETGGVGQSQWGGPILITGTTLVSPSGTPASGFAITYEGVPTALCTRFASQGAPGFYDTKIGGQSVIHRKSVDMVAVVNQCALAPTSTVQFIASRGNTTNLDNPVLAACVPPAPTFPTLTCPAGQRSSIGPAYRFDGITQEVDYFCNGAYGAGGTEAPKPYANTCTPICVAPAPFNDTVSQTTPCAPGRVTPAGAASFAQTESRTLTYSCPIPVGAYSTTTPAYSPWSPLETAACAPQCVAPAPTTGTQTQTASCPSGQVLPSGATTFTQSQSRPVSYSCPAPTGAYATAFGTYGPWSPTAAAAGCSPACIPLAATVATQYQWVGVNAGCPAGYTGAHTYQKQQAQLVTTVYTCLSIIGLSVGANVYGPWLDTGAIQGDSNTCTAPPPPPPACAPAVGQLGGPLVLSNTLCIGGVCQPNLGSIYSRTATYVGATTVTASSTMLWNLATYSVTYSCQVQANTPNTCTLTLASGSLPPGIQMAGAGFTSQSTNNKQIGVGANFGTRACP